MPLRPVTICSATPVQLRGENGFFQGSALPPPRYPSPQTGWAARRGIGLPGYTDTGSALGAHQHELRSFKSRLLNELLQTLLRCGPSPMHVPACGVAVPDDLCHRLNGKIVSLLACQPANGHKPCTPLNPSVKPFSVFRDFPITVCLSTMLRNSIDLAGIVCG